MTVDQGTKTRRAHVLLVEDSSVQAEVIRRLLADAGYTVSIAENGYEALGRIETQEFDLVLLDLTMPGIAGMEVLDSIRLYHTPRELPVIIVTGSDDSEAVVHALNKGANDYVTKPLNEHVFLARVQSQLRIAESDEATKATERPTSDMSLSGATVSFTLESPDVNNMIGVVLARKYRLESIIGRGGFGVVYRANHVVMNKTVAVKTLFSDPQSRDKNLDLLQREAQAACRIDHPNAVTIYDVDIVSDKVPFIVMELLKGKSLADELSETNTLPPQRCAEILLPVCDVLAQAHLAGVIHRDIKPSNIFLHQDARGETVKVLDFGAARIDEILTMGKPTVRNSGRTIRGTPEYAAPERLGNKPYDGKVDVYSLGVVLYEMLTGCLPFQAEDGDYLAVAMKQLNETPRPVRAVNSNISAQMEAVVSRSLIKDPPARSDLHDFARSLAAAASGPDSSTK